MTQRYEWPAVVAFLGIASLGDFLHSFPLPGAWSWGETLPSIYCIPILIAGANLGLHASLGVAFASALVHSTISLLGRGDAWPGPLIDAVFYVVLAVVVARLTRQSASVAVPEPAPVLPQRRPHSDAEPAALGQILAAFVHRIRIPVSSIEGAVDLLDQFDIPENKGREYLRIIRKESRQLDRELSQVLDFVQPRKPEWKQVSLPELLTDVISRVQLASQRCAEFHFRTEIPPGLPLLTCDSEQIGKMLFNLLMNSIQATPGGGLIDIAVQAESDTVAISIRDPGRGIAPTIAGRVFDPFFTNRENALGLGLTIARQIVTSHCGNIVVMKSSDKGTSVTVRLPLAPPDPHEHRSYSGG